MLNRLKYLGVAICIGVTSNAYGAALEQLPNIRALPARDFSVELDFIGRPTLRFGAITWNAGDGALEVLAGETGTNRKGEARQNIYQRIYLDDGSSYQRLAGSFIWHPEHDHFHMNEYALYSLQKVGAKGKSKLTGAKTSFCLMDTDTIDQTLPGSPGQAVYAGCDNVFQGISVGWGDLYGAHLPGQSLDLSGLEAGDYRLSIEADPKNRLLEINDEDNVSCVLLNIDPAALTVNVLNPNTCDEQTQPPGNVTVSGIDPSSVNRGSMVAVTISGTGFQPGASVRFENGSGKRPTVSDVVVVNTTTITATVTASGGGKSATWDLRVDSAVLSDAFTVY